MMKILKSIWLLITAMGVIGGAIGFFFLPIFTGDDYALSLILKSSEKLIENNHSNIGLSVAFHGENVNTLYYTKIQLKNSGKHALTKDFIFEPVTIHPAVPNSILSVLSSSKEVIFSKNNIYIKWSLINPSETIDALIYSTAPIELASSQKIREITKINYVNEIANPPTSKRLSFSKLWWGLFLVLGLYFTYDAILLIRSDIKGQGVINYIKSALERESVNRDEFLSNLFNIYSDYFTSGPTLFITPELLISKVGSVLDSSTEITGRFLEIARREAIDNVFRGNFYNIRTFGILFGPLISGICIVGATISIFL